MEFLSPVAHFLLDPQLVVPDFSKLCRIVTCLLLVMMIALATPALAQTGAQTATQTGGLEGLSFIKKLKLARAGDTDAQLSVAIDYMDGLNQARKDPIEAAKWFREAALSGNLEAQYRLSKLVAKGAPGLASDVAAAVKLVQDAAQRGHAQAQNDYGIRLQKGDGVSQDIAAAAAMFQKAADQNIVQAQVNLGLLLVRGQGLKQNFDAAFALFAKAAENGDPWALNNLGSMYEMGWGVAQDKAKARSLYAQAAAKGNRLAQDNLNRISGSANVTTSSQ
jgi:uncharacterized protein